MNGTDLPELDFDLKNLLAEEQAAPAMPEAMAARIQERLAISIAGVPLSAPDSATEAASGAAEAAAETSTGVLASLATKPLLIAAAAFSVGIGVGVGGSQYLSETQPAAVQQPVETPTTALPIDAGISDLPSYDAASLPAQVDPPELQPSAPPKKTTPITPTKDPGLAAERALLELSRTAITRRDATTALAHLDEHRIDFPKGRLAEERDALRVQALILDHAYTKAKAEAQSYEARYPESVFLPVVRKVVSDLQ